MLHHAVLEAFGGEHFAQVLDVHRLRKAELHLHAAGEVQAGAEANEDRRADGHQDQQRRYAGGDVALAHEVERRHQISTFSTRRLPP